MYFSIQNRKAASLETAFHCSFGNIGKTLFESKRNSLIHINHECHFSLLHISSSSFKPNDNSLTLLLIVSSNSKK